MAQSIGIDTNGFSFWRSRWAYSWRRSGSLALPTFGVSPGLGADTMVLAFAVAAIGGLGQIEGAAVASLIVGLARVLAIYFAPEFQPVVPYRGDAGGPARPSLWTVRVGHGEEDMMARSRHSRSVVVSCRSAASRLASIRPHAGDRQGLCGARRRNPAARRTDLHRPRHVLCRRAPMGRLPVRERHRRFATVALLVLSVLVDGVDGRRVGAFLVRYRAIFFAMLNLAVSMVFYSLFVEALRHHGGIGRDARSHSKRLGCRAQRARLQELLCSISA